MSKKNKHLSAFSKNLRKIRKELKKSQIVFAEDCECNTTTISRLENMEEGEVYDYIQFCIKIEEQLHTSLLEIQNYSK